MSGEKLKVLHITGAMNRGGAEVMLMDIYRNIPSDVHFDFLVNYKIKSGIQQGEFDTEIFEKGGEIKHIGAQWDIGPIKYLKTFKKIVNELGIPDVVHIHLNAKSGIIALAAKKAGVKRIIAHSHANLKFRGSFLYVLFNKVELQIQKFLISKYATHFWGCSEQANDSLFYKKLQVNNKCAIINNAVNVNSFQNVSHLQIEHFLKSNKIGDKTLVLGNVGRVVKHKNVDFIIDILNELAKRNVDFKFVFAGRADDKLYLELIFQKAKDLGVLDKIIYLEDRADIPVIVNSFDVFVGPALQEGFGLVALEAQAAGVPCVLYTGFPKSVDMKLDLVTFINNFDTSNWVDEIIQSKEKKNSNKNLIQNQISSLGFDSLENTKRIVKMYKGINV